MKRLSSLLLLLFPLLTLGQVNEYSAKKLRAADTITLRGQPIGKISTNLNTPDSNSHNMIPTNRAVMDMVRNGGGGGVPATSNFRSDLGRLPQLSRYFDAQGVASNAALPNYSHTSVDSARYKLSTTRAGVSGNEYGGWLFGRAAGDSIRVTAPFWVVFGDSQAEGHPGKHGALHWLLNSVPQSTFNFSYPDSVGQLSYHLRQRTNMRFHNRGIGGQTSVQCRVRFARDVLGMNSIGITDGRGTQTLSRKPEGVIIIAGINDIFNGVPLETIKANLEWFASTCQENGISCVVLNMPGDALAGQSELIKIATINKWLASGVLDQYGACVVDYNRWWNNPAYGYDNIHPTGLIADDIHPSAVGYDSLAAFIFREAHLPVLTKAVFINEVSPITPVGYARPVNITINGVARVLSSVNDTISISSYVPDSVWIKVVSSAPLTGTDTSGFSHIQWFYDNNVTDSVLFTRRTQYAGGSKSNLIASKVSIVPLTGATTPIIDAYLFDNTLNAFKVNTDGAGASVIVNGLVNTAPIQGAAVSAYKTGGYGYATNGSFYSQGPLSIFGSLQVGNNTSPGTSGYGVGVYNGGIHLEFGGSGSLDNDGVMITKFGTLTPRINNPARLQGIIRSNTGWGATNNTDTVASVVMTPVFDDTSSTSTNNFRGGYFYRHRIITPGQNRFFGFWNVNGDNFLNSASGSTIVGSTRSTSFKFFVDGTMAINAPDVPVVGSIGSERILLIDPSTNQVKSMTAAGGSTTTLYTDNGILAGNRTVDADNKSLTFDKVSIFSVNAFQHLYSDDSKAIYFAQMVDPFFKRQLFGYAIANGAMTKGSGIAIDSNNNVSIGPAIYSSSHPGYASGGMAAALSGLTVAKGMYESYITVTNPTQTLDSSAVNVYIDANSNNVTITLPPSANLSGFQIGWKCNIKRIDASANTVTIQGSGADWIDNGPSFTLAPYESATIRSVGSNQFYLFKN